MDDFGAQDGDATQVSLDKLRSCSVYVLLLGWRYGTIPDGETLSVTHLEYRAASDAGMPRFIFLADADTEKDDGPDALFPAAVRDNDHATQVRDFRAEVGHDRVAAFFTTPESAALAVAAALHNYIQREVPSGPHPPLKLAAAARRSSSGVRASFVSYASGCARDRASASRRWWRGWRASASRRWRRRRSPRLAAEPDAFPGGITWARCDEREGLAGLTWLYDQLLADWGAPLAPEQAGPGADGRPGGGGGATRARAAGPSARIRVRDWRPPARAGAAG